jgi:MerR family redox-sensitive transcriptional activator SoxR
MMVDVWQSDSHIGLSLHSISNPSVKVLHYNKNRVTLQVGLKSRLEIKGSTQMKELLIGEVARQAGIRTSTSRYYESIGLLAEPKRVSGRRVYDGRVVERLAIIRTAQQAGFSLDECRVLLDEGESGMGVSDERQVLIQRKLAELNGLMDGIRRMKGLLEDIMECDDEALAECIYLIGQQRMVDVGG